jgi:hypothetical protein
MAGNVCTENVVYLLEELGFHTQVDIDKLKAVGQKITKELERENMCLL